ncbi:MAG: NnrU family protein [Gammaproteobacteria bacterium]|nr:NnrU family protein [Gammaproteobacteria bacterium]MDH3447128.1 NnrU family protein [Gammaproteobacteria bacterium]
MGMLVIGLLLWVAVHLFPSLLPEQRQRLLHRIGAGTYQAIFALCILSGLLLIVFGWRDAVPTPVYNPPAALRQPAMLLVVIAFALLVAANFPATRVKRVLRHPQLSGVLLWAIAHLLMNGDSRSLLLFSVLGAWCLVSMLTINRRDGVWTKPDKPGGWGQDIVIAILALALSAAAVYFHEYLAGVALLA